MPSTGIVLKIWENGSLSEMPVQLDEYRMLGSSGLRVSPLCLGTMTFGDGDGRSSDEKTSIDILKAYTNQGGNFIDTANIYNYGRSEEIIGRFIAGQRQHFVLGSKYSMAMEAGRPNTGGNHRKNLVESVEASLQRLNTDYLDLLWLHVWDFRTPVEEVMRGLDDLVRTGKTLYVAVSDTPAWKVAEANTLARLRGWSPFIAYQAEYSLVERTSDREIRPMCAEHGLTLMPWSPLGGGLLTGKYDRSQMGPPDPEEMRKGSRKGMLQVTGAFNEGNMAIVDALMEIAEACGGTPSQVALAWILGRPGRPLPIIGAKTMQQLDDNLGCLAIQLTEDQTARLNDLSVIDPGFPNRLYDSVRLRESLVDRQSKVEGGFGVKYDYLDARR